MKKACRSILESTTKRSMFRLVIALFMLIMLPRLLTFGQFLDGIIYTSMARNMAEGYGSFWKPYASDLFGEIFYYHPPLSMGLHSLFYRAFGDHHFLDSLWSFLCGCSLVYVAYIIFKKMNKENAGWFPVLLIAIMPMSSWLFSNNLLEAPMTLAVMLSAFFQIRGLSQNNTSTFFFLIIAGFFLGLGVLFKNIVCLFPLIIPLIYWFFFRSITFLKTLIFSAVLFVSLCAFLFAVIYLSHGDDFYREYIHRQLLPGITGSSNSEKVNIFQNINILISELIPPLILGFLVLIFTRTLSLSKFNAQSAFFLILGLSATLPLFFIHKFRTFYIYPGLPFFALSMASFFKPGALKLGEILTSTPGRKKILNISSFIILLISFGLLFYGKDKPFRLKEFKHDILDARSKIPARSQILVCNSQIINDYTLVAAFQRYLKLSVVYSAPESTWLLQDKTISCKIPSKCTRISTKDSLRYNLYSCGN